MYSFVFYVPKDDVEAVKEAMFAAGAGVIGNYRRCAWQVLGKGQFEPMDRANPYIGSVGRLELVEEYKVEMVVKKEVIKEVLEAFRAAHPYEEPAYFISEMAIKAEGW